MRNDTERDKRTALLNSVTGAVIFTIAGGLWMAFGVFSLRERAEPWLAIFLSLVGLGLLGAAYSFRSSARRWVSEQPSPLMEQNAARAGRRFGIVNAAQGVAIFLAVQVCNNLHVPQYLAPTIALIVGLHFIALAPVYRTRSHWVVGGMMCLFALVTVLAVPTCSASAGGNPAAGIFIWGCTLGFGNGVLLWSTAATRLLFLQNKLRAETHETFK